MLHHSKICAERTTSYATKLYRLFRKPPSAIKLRPFDLQAHVALFCGR
jgi:hypothetical protein